MWFLMNIYELHDQINSVIRPSSVIDSATTFSSYYIKLTNSYNNDKTISLSQCLHEENP